MGGLFDGARSGEPAAQAEILRLLRVFAREACRGGGPGAASLDASWEDVAQEAGRKLFATGLAQYRGSGTERSYLFSVVRSTIIQMSRSAARRVRREEATDWETTAPPSNPGPRIDAGKILARLSTECRDLIARVFLQSASYSDLASELRLEESSVRSKVSRCLSSARRIAEEDGWR